MKLIMNATVEPMIVHTTITACNVTPTSVEVSNTAIVVQKRCRGESSVAFWSLCSLHWYSSIFTNFRVAGDREYT
eukprot:TRINITY_DN2882_c0_g1_i1.p2 TRINITY_DN2882_c0_g1~~TRINITY_DN2882_c0_g1_i1.p2  ORF type:complete len:75 (-),score=2.86 TRINITY_DN2882_c0_g1_i1:160-384(-)